MARAQHTHEYRSLPSVDELLHEAPVAALLERYPRGLVVAAAREALDNLRAAISAGNRVQEALAQLPQRVAERVEDATRLSLRVVINATGVVLHTNLGRSPLGASALEAIRETASAYSNLEYNLDQGERGRRDAHAAQLLERLLGAPAVVVNNNAAAIFLALHELAAGGEVVVSRGELVEIGEGFRIPDILVRSGAALREVGTTNRTRIDDYRRAITPQTRVLLRVHRSNFRIVGFTERPSLEELVALGRETRLPVVEDLGSGCLVDLTAYGLEREPVVSDSVAAGVDVVTFSGDKLLGGPQAGVLAGAKEYIGRIRRNPLFRALRVDKLTYAALGATLREYLLGHHDRIPILAMLAQTEEQIRSRATHFLGALRGVPAQLVPGRSVIGGGSTPAMELPTTLIALAPASVTEAERRLRSGSTPVIARIENDRLVLDLRTVLPEQEVVLADALRAAMANSAAGRRAAPP